MAGHFRVDIRRKLQTTVQTLAGRSFRTSTQLDVGFPPPPLRVRVSIHTAG
jgi:hypothetical protein